MTPGTEEPKLPKPPAVLFDMGMAHPNSYDHSTGETFKSWGPATGGMGSQWDWVDYQCGDIVPFLIKATNTHKAGEATPPLTFNLKLAAASDPDHSAAGFTEVAGVTLLSVDPPTDASGTGASLVDSHLHGEPYTPGAKLDAVVQVSKLPAGATAIVRVNVRLTCEIGHRAGCLSAEATGASALPGGEDLAVSPMKQKIVGLNNGYYSVEKTPSVDTIPEPGGPVTFKVDVTNDDEDPLPISEITDDHFGDVTHVTDTVSKTTCDQLKSVPPESTVSCEFTGVVTGKEGDVHTNVVTVRSGFDLQCDEASVVIGAPVASSPPEGQEPPPTTPEPPTTQVPPTAQPQQPAPAVSSALTSTADTTAPVPLTIPTEVAGIRVGGITASALPATGARSTPLMLWLAAALSATGAAYLVAARKPQRASGRR
jgi:LPXTG-motif cell wall-anchored protein